MPISSVIDPERGVVLTTAQGVLTGAEVRQAKTALLEDPQFRPGMRELADLRAVTEMAVSSSDIEQLMAMDAAYTDQLAGYEVAFLATGDVPFGVARMFQMRSDRSDRIAVFRSEAEARAWMDRPNEWRPDR